MTSHSNIAVAIADKADFALKLECRGQLMLKVLSMREYRFRIELLILDAHSLSCFAKQFHTLVEQIHLCLL